MPRKVDEIKQTEIDWAGKKCPECSNGRMGEASLYDDWNGMQTCNCCGHRRPRYEASK